ncbi:ABC transporter substrate-binding protein [Inhella sp.]|uniref:ABC transporter substrate-binding protein n=1 Tax=Inhella sp. TaxID=1921806 RepID=UPI0035B13B41
MKRLLLAGLLALCALAQAEAPKKTLRYAFRVAETGFDPARINDLYSRTITPHIFEPLVSYDHLARPAKLKPMTAVELPTPNADFTVWTARIRPGIYFSADPAFKGVKRELVAADYAYALRRFADPLIPSPGWTSVESWGIQGLKALREQAQKAKRGLDYERPIPGLQVLDRYTLRIVLDKPNPRFLQELAGGDLYGAVAREVVEAYGDDTMAHPVGTGPFVLTEWKRGSRIVLERNPDYRERFYDAEPNADDAEGQALLKKFKGRRLPMVDRVEIAIIEENQPRWLAFLKGEHDFIERVPEDFISLAAPNAKLAPNLTKQGMHLHRTLNSEVYFQMFNMDDPVVGGFAPEKVALRRAIGLGMDLEAEIRLVRRGQAIPAQGFYTPNTVGYDARLKTENGEFNPAKSKGLLDLYGYKDRDGDGCRDAPDGGPLKLEMNTTPEAFQRQIDERFDKDMKRIGLCVDFKAAKWPEQLKAARAGKYQMWMVATSADKPDGQSSLARFHSAQVGGQNMSRFRLPEMDSLYEQIITLPEGPERLALMARTVRLAVAYMPIKFKGHRFLTDIERTQMSGYRRPLFWQNWWEYVDVDPAAAAR